MNVLRDTFHHIKNFPKAFWVVILASLLNQMGNMAFVFLVLYLSKHMGFSLAQSSFAFATFSGSMLVTGLFGGSYVDRIGPAPLMAISILLNGIILLSFPLFHHYGLILFLCVLWGIAYGLYRPAAQTFISHLSSAGMHKITFSVYRLALNLGMSIGPAVGGFLAAHSFAAIFIANGAANILAGLVFIIGLWGSHWFRFGPIGGKKSFDPGAAILSAPVSLFKDKALLTFVIGVIPISMVFFQHEATLPIFLNHQLHLPLSFFGLLFTLNTLIIAVFELPLNVATLNWPYKVNFALGSLLITAGFAGFALASVSWHIILLTIIWTIGEMILFPSSSSYIADIAPENKRGSYMSLFTSCSNLGMMLGPWAGAIVMQHWGATTLWVACGVWGLLSVVIFWQTTEPVE